MDNLDWKIRMQELQQASDFFDTCNVVDIEFSNSMSLQVATNEGEVIQASKYLKYLPPFLDGILTIYENGSYVPVSTFTQSSIAWMNNDGVLFDVVNDISINTLYAKSEYHYVLQCDSQLTFGVGLNARIR